MVECCNGAARPRQGLLLSWPTTLPVTLPSLLRTHPLARFITALSLPSTFLLQTLAQVTGALRPPTFCLTARSQCEHVSPPTNESPDRFTQSGSALIVVMSVIATLSVTLAVAMEYTTTIKRHVQRSDLLQ